jgi:hypothetical protein
MSLQLLKRSFALCSVLCVSTVVFSGFSTHAEGSKNLLQTSDYRPFLEHSTQSSTANIPRKSSVFVWAKAGEKIALGSSANGVGVDGSIEYVTANNVKRVCSKTTGVISTLIQENAGPLPAVGGYDPCLITVTNNTAGVFKIDFIAPDKNAVIDTNKNPVPTSKTTQWAQPNNVPWVAAWDVTVLSSTNTPIPGRTYVNYFALNLGGTAGQRSSANGPIAPSDLSLNSQLYVQTPKGYQYKVTLPSVDGFGFVFSSNDKGLTSGTNSIYKSINLAGNNPNWTLPSGLAFLFDNGVLNANKIFLQKPASDLPESSKIGSGNTWLVNDNIDNITAESITFVNSGSSSSHFRFRKVSDTGARYLIKIDANNNNIYTDSVDVILNGNLIKGDNKINWNGLNSQGQAIVRPTGGIKTNVQILSSETHFSLSEAENNAGGLIVERVTPQPQDFDLFFNNDFSSANGFGLSLNGVNSTTGANKWTNALGNGRVMDSWVYGITQNVNISI